MNGTNGNEPGYPENALVPYPVIVAATKGDPDAMKKYPVYSLNNLGVGDIAEIFAQSRMLTKGVPLSN